MDRAERARDPRDEPRALAEIVEAVRLVGGGLAELRERVALEPLHRDPEAATLLAGVEDGHDVHEVERAEHRRLAMEALDVARIDRASRVEHLQGDDMAALAMTRAVHGSAARGRDVLEHLVGTEADRVGSRGGPRRRGLRSARLRAPVGRRNVAGDAVSSDRSFASTSASFG